MAEQQTQRLGRPRKRGALEWCEHCQDAVMFWWSEQVAPGHCYYFCGNCGRPYYDGPPFELRMGMGIECSTCGAGKGEYCRFHH